MAESTGISWTDRTFNPWIGCTKVSPGCSHCYAEHIVEVFPMAKGRGSFRKLWRTQTWGDPPKWNRVAVAAGRRELVFTCSMSDFFHEQADEWRQEAWALIKATPNLEYQILTKRPERIADCLPADWGLEGYPNVWLGASVEMQRYADERIPILLNAPAKIHFISAEPLLGNLDLRPYFDSEQEPDYNEDGTSDKTIVYWPKGLDWVILGGESGKAYRPMKIEWAASIKEQCDDAGVPFFGKQRSGPTNELPLLIGGRQCQAFPAGFAKAAVPPRAPTLVDYVEGAR